MESRGTVYRVRDHMVGAVTSSANACARNASPLQQGACTDAVVTPARRDEYGKRPFFAVAGEMDLRSQPSSRSTEGVIVRFVLPVPPLAWSRRRAGGPDDGGVDLDQPVDATGGARPGRGAAAGPE